MKTIEYGDLVDKSDWAEGPWQHEPDKVQWLDATSGLPCLILRHPELGHLCGYVGVPEGHPYFEKPDHEVDSEVDIGRTINYSDFCRPADNEMAVCHTVEPGENDRVWWLGFAAGLSMRDLEPFMTAGALQEIGLRPPSPDRAIYRDIAYTREHVELLARTLQMVRPR